jgi:hypothetical protein
VILEQILQESYSSSIQAVQDSSFRAPIPSMLMQETRPGKVDSGGKHPL